MNWDEHFRRMSRPVATFGNMPSGPMPTVIIYPKAYPIGFGFEGNLAVRSTFGADPNVQNVQHALNALGLLPPLKEDGIYGPKTNTAISNYQRAHGLTATGRADAPTLKSLGLTPTKLPPLATVPLAPIPGVKQIVVDTFPAFSVPFEGKINFPYTDSKCYVSTGIGFLMDPISLMLTAPWKHQATWALATPAEITAAWHKVKDACNKAHPASAMEQQGLTDLRLTDVDIGNLMRSKMIGNHQVLQSEFPNYKSWPADAQLFAHSASWAWGPGFASEWEKDNIARGFKAAVNQSTPDFAKAAEIQLQADTYEVVHNKNAGMATRAAANNVLLNNAHAAVNSGADPDSLFYPNDFWSGMLLAVTKAPEQALAFARGHVGLSVGTLLAIVAGILGLLVFSGGQTSRYSQWRGAR